MSIKAPPDGNPTKMPVAGSSTAGRRGALIALERLGFGDLDAKSAEADIGARACRQELDRGDSEVAQNLRAETDFTPLDVALALGVGGGFLADGRNRHTGRAVA